MTCEPWPTEKRRELHAQAVNVSRHSSHADQIARDNCGACALSHQTMSDAPDYAGWLRIYIQLGWPMFRKHYNAELDYAEAENPQYYDAIMRDIATFGPAKINELVK